MPSTKPTPTDTITMTKAEPKKGKVWPYKLYISVARPNGLRSMIKLSDVDENLHADVEKFLNLITFGKPKDKKKS